MGKPRRENEPARKPQIFKGVFPPSSRLNFEKRVAMVDEGQGFEKKSYHVLAPGPHPDDRNKNNG